MATYRNLRYCQVLHDSVYYNVLIGVSTLDEVNDILQEWALANSDIGEALDLPSALIINTEAKNENLISKTLDTNVYIKSSVSAYMDSAPSAGVTGTFPTMPKVLVVGEYVMPACTANLWSTATFSGVFGEHTIASDGLTLTADEVNFIGIDYNAGSPQYTVYTAATSFNYSSIIPVGMVLYFDGEINVITFGQAGAGLAEKLVKNQYHRKDFEIVSDFTLAEGADLYVELSQLIVNTGTNNITCLAMDTETADNDMWLWYQDATSSWQQAQSDTINNTQYQGAGTGLQVLAGGEFVINYIYRVIDDTNLLIFNVISSNFATLAAAKESDMLTDLPDAIKEGAVLVGRFIVEQGSSAPTVQKIQRVNPFATVV